MLSFFERPSGMKWLTEWTLNVYEYSLITLGLKVEHDVTVKDKYDRTKAESDEDLQEISIHLKVYFPIGNSEYMALSEHRAYIDTQDIIGQDEKARTVLCMALNVFLHETTTKLMDRARHITDMIIQADEMTDLFTDEDRN